MIYRITRYAHIEVSTAWEVAAHMIIVSSPSSSSSSLSSHELIKYHLLIINHFLHTHFLFERTCSSVAAHNLFICSPISSCQICYIFIAKSVVVFVVIIQAVPKVKSGQQEAFESRCDRGSQNTAYLKTVGLFTYNVKEIILSNSLCIKHFFVGLHEIIFHIRKFCLFGNYWKRIIQNEL